jgi:spore germination protein GerM
MSVKRRRNLKPLLGSAGGAAVGWVLAVILLVCVASFLWWYGWPWGDRLSPRVTERDTRIPAGEEITLWYTSLQQDALVAEKRRISPTATTVERAKLVLIELIAGPQSDALRTLASEVQVRELFIDEQGTAYIDFSEALSLQHPSGPWSEMLTIRSIVQTLAANIPEIKRVQILIEGREVDTLAGHIDIRRPFASFRVINER